MFVPSVSLGAIAFICIREYECAWECLQLSGKIRLLDDGVRAKGYSIQETAWLLFLASDMQYCDLDGSREPAYKEEDRCKAYHCMV